MVEFINGQRISFDIERSGQMEQREGTVERTKDFGGVKLVTLHQPQRPERQYGNYYTSDMRNVRVID